MKKKQKGGASVYILSIYVIVLALLFFAGTAHARHLNVLRDQCDTGLLLSLMGAATINVEEYGMSGNKVIHEVYTGEDILNSSENLVTNDIYLQGAYRTFEKLLRDNLQLDEQMQASNSLIIGAVEIENFTVYNVYENELTGDTRTYVMTFNNNAWSSAAMPINEVITIYDNAGDSRQVTTTTLYARIGFVIPVFPWFPELQKHIADNEKTLRVQMDRIVAIPTN